MEAALGRTPVYKSNSHIWPLHLTDNKSCPGNPQTDHLTLRPDNKLSDLLLSTWSGWKEEETQMEENTQDSTLLRMYYITTDTTKCEY